MAVNPGVPKALFGFDGQQLVGQPLSACIDAFTTWKEGTGEEFSLLELLVSQMLAATTDAGLTKASPDHPGGACASWRVGVHRPTLDAGPQASGLVSAVVLL